MPFVTASSNRDIYYSVDTPENVKHTLFFIHGLGSSSSFYYSIIPHLRSLGVRSICMDTYGSGLSTLSSSDPEGKQSIQSIVEDILKILKDLNVKEKVIIVGHSMGGIVASTLASKYPDLLKGLVLLSAVEPSPALSQVFQKRIESIEREGNLESIAASVPTVATGPDSTPLQHAFIRSLILSTSTRGYISLCRVIAEAERPDCSKIKLPILFLAGADDYVVPLSTALDMFESYGTKDKDKSLQALRETGHWPCVESPVEVGKHIGAFAQGFDE